VRRFMSRPAIPGMMPSASLQLAILPLKKLPMVSRHGTSPSLAQATLLTSGATFTAFHDDVRDKS
jgi:hypothetical protein